MESESRFHLGITAWSIIVGNIIVLFLTLYFHWNIGELIALYWLQSVIVGVFTVIKLAFLVRPKMRLLPKNYLGAPNWFLDRVFGFISATFFFFHYGMFHLVYFMLLTTVGVFIPILLVQSRALYLVGFLLISEIVLLIQSVRKKTLTSYLYEMFQPYKHVFVMHLTIGFGFILAVWSTPSGEQMSLGAGPLIWFVFLKIVAEVIGYQIAANVKK